MEETEKRAGRSGRDRGVESQTTDGFPETPSQGPSENGVQASYRADLVALGRALRQSLRATSGGAIEPERRRGRLYTDLINAVSNLSVRSAHHKVAWARMLGVLASPDEAVVKDFERVSWERQDARRFVRVKGGLTGAGRPSRAAVTEKGAKA